jgi:phosphoenolpyruvate---glycerone phosphotransferase subunit DhaL
MMNTPLILSIADAIFKAIIAHEADIESLDRAIGDGDHYINMKRGNEVIAAMHDDLIDLSPADAFNKIGVILLSTIGGASGPLFGSFFMSMGKTLNENGSDTPLQIAAGFAAGVQAIMKRGKAQLGEKTMLDVLIPVSTTFTTMAASDKSINNICGAIMDAASEGLASTKNMIATKGRAAGLGERAIGHLDAGAKSCEVMIHAACTHLSKQNSQ